MNLPHPAPCTGSPKRLVLLENFLVLAVLAVTFVMWSYSIENTILLHLFYVPVVITGFCLGRYRARLMAFLCILSGCIIFLPKMQASVTDIPGHTLLVFVLWATILVLIAMVVGRLSDDWQEAMISLRKSHEKDVLTDALTGVANRRAYEFELARRLAQRERDGSPLILMLLDIDYFKKFNDRYGHTAGDAVLQEVAKTLQATIRKADLVARYGGEEFAIILPAISFDEAKDVGERIRQLVESQRVYHEDLMLRVTVSVGFAQLRPGEEAQSLTNRADAALYSSKEAGRNCVFFHDGIGCRQVGTMSHSGTPVSSPNEELDAETDQYSDETTGLPTQRVLVEELRRRTAGRHRYGIDVVLAVVKVDGYQGAANRSSRRRKSLMATIARVIASELRETDLIVRYNTDSFAILMPSTTLRDAAFPLRRICNKAANYQDARYPGLSYAVSIGITEVGGNDLAGTVMQNVELALAAAINAGGGCLALHEQNVCHVPLAMQS